MAFRTKKISQMDPKGSNLASTDLLEISELVSGSYVTKSITGAEIIASVPPTTVEWGDIGGTLSSQTDLNTALSGKVPTTRTLTINGTTQDLSADRTFTISTGITIGTTAITSGTVGRVLFEGTGNVVQESANLFWDNTNGRLGIGTATPTDVLDIRKNQVTTSVATTTSMLLSNTNASGIAAYVFTSDGTTRQGGLQYNNTTGFRNLFSCTYTDIPYYFGTNNLIRFTITGSTGNVLINTTTDAGFKLDVNGTARVSGQITTTTANAQFGAIGASTGEFRIDGVNGAAYAFSVYSSNTLRFGVTGYGGVTTNNNSLDLGTNFLNARSARFGTSGANATIDLQSQSGVNPMSLKISNGTTAFFVATSGSVLVNTTTDIASSRFTINSTTQGFLPPRMDTTQKNAIATPATGLMVYDTTLNLISVYNGTTWITL